MSAGRSLRRLRRRVVARGAADAVPIALSYFAVSFSFGIAARRAGVSIAASSIMSATNLASAGQFAGLGMLVSSGGLLMTAATELVVNIRYALMSTALSQKLPPGASLFTRLRLAYLITDEIFALSVLRPGRLDPLYTYGLALSAVPGWVLGTMCGAAAGGLLPERALSALGVALYGMFIGIVVPPARKQRGVAAVVAASMLLSSAMAVLPVLRDTTEGTRIIVLTIAVAAAAAALDPSAGRR